ncbi:Phage antirepressor protein YoqD, KilAC domain [Kosakonia arachidis]|uniref:Phage antirepressor protein YoqD, KilAC domain n=1 Tax=Kosakonia arachidis TaxID=551989 RepID=A0A1I7BFV0_9ENTR|nr:phage antirepressor KilAC domain-containing protein [Kosakonia arachidis]SFT86044.1 Phage antirepressor protein YoqD, KilAC domain [Kosakonia arachidis]
MVSKKITALTGSGQTHPEISQNDISGNNFAVQIPVAMSNIGGKEIQSVSGRKLHTFLAIGRDFTNWIKGRIQQYGFVEGLDYVIVENLTSPKRASAKSRQQMEHDYLITIDMAKELAMVERNEKGREVRRYFINCERQSKTAANIPDTLPEALRLAADLAEKARELESRLVAVAPKVDFADRVADISKGISIPNYAKAVGLGPIKLFEWMRQKGILINGGQRHNLPMQRYIDSGYFAVRQGTYETNGEIRASFTTMLTGKGEQWLTQKLIAGGVLPEVLNADTK